MRIGVFADTHDHLDNIRAAVEQFNRLQVELVLFAGDIVSTFAVPPLRKLNCRIIACHGDNEGNKLGLEAGISLNGEIGEPPLCVKLPDGTKILLAHMLRQFRGMDSEFDVAIFGHTHKPKMYHDDQGRLFLNPGETSGWTFRRPTIALLETDPLRAEILDLEPLPREASVEQ